MIHSEAFSMLVPISPRFTFTIPRCCAIPPGLVMSRLHRERIKCRRSTLLSTHLWPA